VHTAITNFPIHEYLAEQQQAQQQQQQQRPRRKAARPAIR
jgi:hypothetical protein